LEAQQHKKYAQTTLLDDEISSLLESSVHSRFQTPFFAPFPDTTALFAVTTDFFVVSDIFDFFEAEIFIGR
jgi:hypothetical protein